MARNVTELKIDWFILLDVDLFPSPNLYKKISDFIKPPMAEIELYLILVFEADSGRGHIFMPNKLKKN